MNEDSTLAFRPRILIVENEEGTVAKLVYKLRNTIPDAEIETASTVVEGQAKLHAAYDLKQPFDVALLDFRLPHDPGSGEEKGDFSLRIMRDLTPETLVIHMTAYAQDKDFRRVRPPPDTPPEANRLFVDKLNDHWMREITEASTHHIREARVRFHSERIRGSFDALFRRGEMSPSPRVSASRKAAGRSDRAHSLDVATLCADAAQHWEFLNPPLQADLERVLGHTQDEKGKHYVGIIKHQPGDEGSGEEQDLAL